MSAWCPPDKWNVLIETFELYLIQEI